MIKLPREQFPRNFLVADVARMSCMSDMLRGCYEDVMRKL